MGRSCWRRPCRGGGYLWYRNPHSACSRQVWQSPLIVDGAIRARQRPHFCHVLRSTYCSDQVPPGFHFVAGKRVNILWNTPPLTLVGNLAGRRAKRSRHSNRFSRRFVACLSLDFPQLKPVPLASFSFPVSS